MIGIEYRDIATLKLWQNNYNQGNVGAIVQSIRRLGWSKTLLVWNGYVMAGNTSLKALWAIRADGPRDDRDWPPSGVLVDSKTGFWSVPVQDISHLTEQEAVARAIADNRLAQDAEIDEALLAQHLIALQQDDSTLVGATGHTPDDIDALLVAMGGTDHPDPDPPAKTVTCPDCGHTWEV